MEEASRPGHVSKGRLKSKGAAGVRRPDPPLPAVSHTRADLEAEPVHWTYDEVVEAR